MTADPDQVLCEVCGDAEFEDECEECGAHVCLECGWACPDCDVFRCMSCHGGPGVCTRCQRADVEGER